LSLDVKDESFNVKTMITTLKINCVNCETFSVEVSFQGTFFKHAFFKAYKYKIVEEKICESLNYVSIKFVQVDLQKCRGKGNKSG